MKKVLIALALPTILGCAVLLWPRPVKAESVQDIKHEQVIRGLFEQVRQSETLTQELIDTHMEIAYMALRPDNECLVCQAMALLVLRGNDDNWADTLGECVDDDELDMAIADVLYDSECKHID